MSVSVICTVLNEGESIRALLHTLVAQTRRPDEVVFVDGGSRDNTVAVLREYEDRLPLRVIVEPGANISRGRNVAVAAARGDIIASCDAGVRLEPQWLAELVGPIEAGAAEVTGGFFVSDPRSTFEIALGATTLPDEEDIDPQTFLPSSRSVAFTRSAWERAGKYPEWLDYCEDLIFDLRLRDEVTHFAWAPQALAHFRPRGTAKAFAKQYYRYARGDGKADLWRKRHAIRYGTYLLALPLLLGLTLFHRPWWLLALLAGVGAYCRTPYRRLAKRLPALEPREQARAVALVPLIRVVGDVAKMAGYPAGWVWRIRNWQRPEIHWRKK
ncbi:MAG: glycosyltransferase [Anaerolineae bacterium]|jgi:glycosyltransferase involved in cell wall biosynthesis|nr:glycosyltransferase [Anaerolineae bacterium]